MTMQGYPQQQGYQQGPPPKSGMPTWVKVLIALFVLGMCGVGGCIVCVGLGAKKVADTIETQAASAKAADDTARAAPVDVPIKTLLGDYKNNEVRADEQYKGKYVKTAGIVQDVKKDLTDSIYLTVGATADLAVPVVQCFPPDSEKADAAKLNKGDAVAITGKVDGLMFNVIVRSCEIRGSKAPPAAPPAPAKKK